MKVSPYNHIPVIRRAAGKSQFRISRILQHLGSKADNPYTVDECRRIWGPVATIAFLLPQVLQEYPIPLTLP
jgi:hypothetical protein